ncbi:ligase-associated DNA damage response exonuclease [Nannocystis pusilla]|uniref:Ligase-associated DNA damage response exonuclease n=1 Tax=Nannocystis pusilla TaxID=889268 RepID=A0ABS7TKL2_9BACT|nr:ligase-associated DNA damage response exonuclease [Nannocystis pusilla]MBZ5708760.1 ligase-associated DNA damage response exonuclease [Nannocystis pusilla]
MRDPLIKSTERGLYCAAGDFYIDPWQPVDRAVVTHAHSDHAVPECAHYLTTAPGRELLALRVGEGADIQPLAYGQPIVHHGVGVSLHPAGHILGSAQVRLEHRGEVWLVSGDYKLSPDPTCAPFESVRCHCLISESTFGLPIFRWAPPAATMQDITAWWQANQQAGRTSLLLCYALGKAQRLLAGLDPERGPIYVHGAVERCNAVYRAAGVPLPPAPPVLDAARAAAFERALILAPPSAQNTPWTRRFKRPVRGFASGWMQIRGTRRRRVVDRGFALSDHADWPELLAAIAGSGAERVLLTHGYAQALARHLREQGLDAQPLATRFLGEAGGEEDVHPDMSESPDDAAPDADDTRESDDLQDMLESPADERGRR